MVSPVSYYFGNKDGSFLLVGRLELLGELPSKMAIASVSNMIVCGALKRRNTCKKKSITRSVGSHTLNIGTYPPRPNLTSKDVHPWRLLVVVDQPWLVMQDNHDDAENDLFYRSF